MKNSASRRPRILMVCYGNLCRSPMAEGLMRSLLGDGWDVGSAGTHAGGGAAPTRLARRVMLDEAGIDIGWQRSMPLTAGAINGADWVFTMSRSQQQVATRLAPEAAERVLLFGAFAVASAAQHGGADPGGPPATEIEVPDPMGGSVEEYRRCRLRLTACAEACAAWLRAGAPLDGRQPLSVSRPHVEKAP